MNRLWVRLSVVITGVLVFVSSCVSGVCCQTPTTRAAAAGRADCSSAATTNPRQPGALARATSSPFLR